MSDGQIEAKDDHYIGSRVQNASPADDSEERPINHTVGDLGHEQLGRDTTVTILCKGLIQPSINPTGKMLLNDPSLPRYRIHCRCWIPSLPIRIMEIEEESLSKTENLIAAQNWSIKSINHSTQVKEEAEHVMESVYWKKWPMCSGGRYQCDLPVFTLLRGSSISSNPSPIDSYPVSEAANLIG
ncbi:hypothetical protein ACTXT7_003938 [Hymenolepis weldensis]